MDGFYSRLLSFILNMWARICFPLSVGARVLSDGRVNHSAESKVVVSLTSYKGRIHSVWLTIESILRQKSKPDYLILWLSKEEFKDESEIPPSLAILRQRGLRIVFKDQNLRSHKKYFYALSEFKGCLLITVDDDVIYPPTLIGDLLDGNARNPRAICAITCRKVLVDGNRLAPYSHWPYVNASTGPSHAYVQIGASGVLYPPNCFLPEVLSQERILSMAPNTDDLWLKVMAVISGTKVKSLAGKYNRAFVTIRGSQDSNLMSENIAYNNDNCFRDLLAHYSISKGVFRE